MTLREIFLMDNPDHAPEKSLSEINDERVRFVCKNGSPVYADQIYITGTLMTPRLIIGCSIEGEFIPSAHVVVPLTALRALEATIHQWIADVERSLDNAEASKKALN